MPDCSSCCRHGQKTTIYKYYATSDGQPLRLHMHGNDISSGAHFGKMHPHLLKLADACTQCLLAWLCIA